MPMLVYGGHMFQWADHLHNHPPVTRYLLCFFFNHYFKIPLKFLMHILLFSYFFKLVFLRLNSQDVISVSNMTQRGDLAPGSAGRTPGQKGALSWQGPWGVGAGLQNRKHLLRECGAAVSEPHAAPGQLDGVPAARQAPLSVEFYKQEYWRG